MPTINIHGSGGPKGGGGGGNGATPAAAPAGAPSMTAGQARAAASAANAAISAANLASAQARTLAAQAKATKAQADAATAQARAQAAQLRMSVAQSQGVIATARSQIATVRIGTAQSQAGAAAARAQAASIRLARLQSGGGGGSGAGAAMRGVAGNFGLAGLVGMATKGPIGMIVAAVTAAVLAPQMIASLQRRALSSAEPYMGLKEGAYSLARAGGYSGEGAFRPLFPGGYQTPEFMSRLGITPDSAMESLSRYGIAPRSNAEQMMRIKELRTMALSPAFAGMPEGTAESAGRFGVSMGLGGPGNTPVTFLSQVSRLMEGAIERGMDRTQVLSSIQNSLDTMAQSGAAGISTSSTIELLGRMFNSGMPGARTGALQGQAISGMEGAIGSLGSDPVRTMMMYQAMSKAGLQNQGQLRDFLGPEAYDQIKGTKGGEYILNAITSEMSAGRPAIAMMYARQALSGNPARFAQIMQSQIPGGMSSPLQTIIGSQVTGVPLGAYIAMQSGDSIAPGTVGARTGAMGEGLAIGAGGRGGFNAGMDYAGALRAAGIPEELIGSLIEQGRRNDISPLVLASVATAETGGVGYDASYGYGKTNSKGQGVGIGVMQVTGSTAQPILSQMLGRNVGYREAQRLLTDPDLNIAVGAQYLNQQRGTGDIMSGVAGYGPQDQRQAYSSRVGGIIQQMSGTANLPSDVYGARASTAQAELAGSATSWHEFASNLDLVNRGLRSMASVLEQVAKGQPPGVGTIGGPSSGGAYP